MRPTRGVSIAETLVAVFLLALLVTVLFNLYPATVVANRQGSQRMQAERLAQTVLSSVRTKPFPTLTPGLTETLPNETIQGTTYSAKYVILPPEPNESEDLRKVEVSVEWTLNNRPRSLKEKVWIHRLIEQ